MKTVRAGVPGCGYWGPDHIQNLSSMRGAPPTTRSPRRRWRRASASWSRSPSWWDAVSAEGNAHVTRGVEGVAVIPLHFGEQMTANIVASWLDPRKVGELAIVGNSKMLVYDDVSPNEKIRIYDKGVEGPSHFVECIRTEAEPRSSDQVGARVVKILAAANESLRQGGGRVGLG